MPEFCFESINWSPYFGQSSVSVHSLIEAASAAGYSWISFDEALLNAAQAEGISLSNLRDAVEHAHLQVLAVHSLAITGEAERDLATAERLIIAARELDAPYLHCGVVGEMSDSLRASAKQVAARARESRVAIAIEFLPFLAVASIADTRAVIEACEDEGAGMVVDAWHFFHGPDGWDALEAIRPEEIAYVQFDDHPALQSRDLLEETTTRRVLPGQGEFDLQRFADVCRESGWNGVVGLELLSKESRNDSPVSVADALLRVSKPYWEKA